MKERENLIYTCIDDYGLGFNHNETIRKIVKTGLISGVTTFVGMKNFHKEASALLEISNITNFQIGLHLDFTNFFPFIQKPSLLNSDSFSALFIAFNELNILKSTSIRDTIFYQLEIFSKSFGRPPDFIDGHYHLHQTSLPIKSLLSILEEKNFQGWVRTTCMDSYLNHLSSNISLLNKIKIRYLNSLGRKAKKAISNKFRTNDNFIGYTDLNSNNAYLKQLSQQLELIKSPTLFMLHPGSSEDEVQIDTHDTKTRDLETEWLLGDFEKKCSILNLNIIKDFNNLWIKV